MTDTLNEKLVNILGNILKESVVEIDFFKVDGTVRKMLATLKPELLPASNRGDEYSEMPTKVSSVQVVYDIEAKCFRSYRKDNIIYFAVSSEHNKEEV